MYVLFFLFFFVIRVFVLFFFFFQAEDGIRDVAVTGVQTCALPISVRRFNDYEAKLKAAKVVLDPQARKDIILADAKQLAFAQGFELIEDQVLLDEVAGLVEWPGVLME